MIRLVLSLFLAMVFASAPVFQAQAELMPAPSSPDRAANVSDHAMESMAECGHCDECNDKASMPDCATPCLMSCTGGFNSLALLSGSQHDIRIASSALILPFASRRADALFDADPPPPRLQTT